MRLSPVLAAAAWLALAAALPAQIAPAAPAAPAAPGGAAASEEITIPGVVLTRPDGRFLGVETEGAQVKITFYDKDKKKEPADAVRISARWRDGNPKRAVLLPAGAETLVSPTVFGRPFNYLVFLALVGADDQVLETHSLRLQ